VVGPERERGFGKLVTAGDEELCIMDKRD